MIDQKTLAYTNLYSVLGNLENLCEIDETARSLLTNEKPISIAFIVRNGPKGVLNFEKRRCIFLPNQTKADILSCEKFNLMIEGKAKPIPVKGFSKIDFLLNDFMNLTNRLEELMRPCAESLRDADFKRKSTTLMCYTIASAVEQIGNYDFIGQFSASHIADGNISFEIKSGPAITISSTNHILKFTNQKCTNPRARIVFTSFDIARDLFDGKANSMACVCDGKILMTGLISMLDNFNRILDRVALYLR